MISRLPLVSVCPAMLLFFVLSLPGIADARGGGGRGGGGRSYSRSSPARGGDFSSEVPSQLPAETRQERRDSREDIREDRRDRRDDYYPGDVDYYGDPVYEEELPCDTSAIVVNGATYYDCDGTWYRRGYADDSVVYVITEEP